jgi:hypothetical protein
LNVKRIAFALDVYTQQQKKSTLFGVIGAALAMSVQIPGWP